MTNRSKGSDVGALVRMASARGLYVLSVVVLLGGCALLGRNDDDDGYDRRSRDGPVTLEIQNDNFNDARIYVHWNGARRRLGLVTGKTTGSFEMRWEGNEIRVEVDFIAAGDYITDPMTVWPGEALHLWIPPSP